MANPNDPMPTPPDPKTDPAKAGPKPDGAAERSHTDDSAFDFELPKDVDPLNDPLPLGPPEGVGASAPDIHLPPRPVAAKPSSGSFDLIELPEVPPAPPAPADDGLDLPFALEASEDSGNDDIDLVPTAPATSDPPSSFVLPPPSHDPAPGLPSTPDISTLLPPPEVPTAPPGTFTDDPAIAELELPLGELEPIDPASGWLDHPVVPPDAPPAARASFDFTLPEGVQSFGDLPPVPQPVPDDTGTTQAALPPRPAATHPAAEATSFDFIELAEGDAAPADPTVEPASGWLDSAIQSGPPAEPAQPAEQSDVLAAAAAAAPDSSGETTDPDVLDELAMADEMDDSGTLLMNEGVDGDSIHEMPDPLIDPLFDSTRLNDLPSGRVHDDMPDYGAAPPLSSDASSILADLNEPFGQTGADSSSSVRVEEPGVGRTFTAGPADGAFDLTIADEPMPADLFAASPEGPATDATDWHVQSGSDLFADAQAGADVDLGSGPVDAVDLGEIDLRDGPVSLSSAPSSIFSDQPAVPGATSGASANVQIGTVEPNDAMIAGLADGDVAEFTDHPTLNSTAEPEKGPKPRRAGSSDVAPAPAAEDGGAIDWDAAGLADDEHATRGMPQDASLSSLMSSLQDDSSELPTRNERPVARIDDDGGAEGPVVTVDWLASSGEGSAVSEAQVAESKSAPAKKTKDRKEKDKPVERGPKKRSAPVRDEDADETVKVKPFGRKTDDSGEQPKRKSAKEAKKGGGILVGALLGSVLAGGALAGVYFGGLVPNSETVTQAPAVTPSGPGRPGGPGQGGPGAPGRPEQGAPAAAANPKAEFSAGGTAKALELLNATAPNTAEEKAAAGYVRLFAKVQEAAKANAATVAADDAGLKQARADLEAVMADAEALKTAEGEKTAVLAAVRLGVSYEVAGDLAKARQVFTDAMAKFPKHAAVFETQIDRLDAADKSGGTSLRAAPKLDPEDAQRVLFAVSVLLADGPNAEGDPEPGLFYWKAVNQAAAGKYPEALDLIGRAKAAHIKRARAQAGRGLNPLTDPLEQMFARNCDELTAYWKLRGELYSNPAVAAAIKKDGVAKVLDTLAKAEKGLETAKAEVAKSDKELKAAKDAAELRTKEYQANELEAAKKLTSLTDEREKLEVQVRRLKEQVATAQEFYKGVADALKPAVALPEKWALEDAIAGVKTAAARATGPDLKALVPNAMMAIGGGGLAAGQLLDVADRLTKAETAAKAAADKLVTETTKLKTDHAAEVKKLTDDSTAEAKKLTEKYAADAKQLADTHAAELKKRADDNAAAVKKLKEDNEAALKAEQARTAAEKKAAADKDAGFQKQLANAVTPAQAMDLWLPMLTDLRRPSDADPALAAAARARESAVPGSEDAAKARTVAGMALLLKGDLAAAKEEFQAARRGAAYEAAKGKTWAKVADAGLEAVDDPLAPYRQPVVIPPVDAKTATKALDAGILAYKAGRYEEAAAELAAAAKNDPADPVAWYYLGAARWVRGDTKQAEKDFSQGAEREKTSPVPARTVSAALAPIQGAVRDALDRARP